jgi:energy-coupling factor transporter transmembrane protein EcfT
MTDITDKILVYGFLAFASIIIMMAISLPTLIAFFINRWLTKKGIRYIGVLLLIAAPIWTAYEVYIAINPTDKFYFSEFKEVTLRNAPKSAKIISKDASYPYFHGDYCSASLITMSAEDYQTLLNDLTNDKRLIKNMSGDVIGSRVLNKVMGNYKAEQIIYSFTQEIEGEGDKYLYIGFLDNNRTILVSITVT